MQDSVSDVLGAPIFQGLELNQDGSLKENGKQNIKFRNQKVLSFRAKPRRDAEGNAILDPNGKEIYDIDPKTGLPFKEAFEEIKEFVRVETKGDTNIKDDVANDMDRRQHYRQYKHFREGRIPDGNPIENFDFLQPSTIMEMHMLGVHVIEQVAEMTDLVCEQLKDQSGYEVRDIAAQWLKINSPQSQGLRLTKDQSELARLRKEVTELRAGRPRMVEQLPEVPAVPEAPLQTMELSAEELASSRKTRTRKV